MFRILTKADILLFLTLVVIGAGTIWYGSNAIINSTNKFIRITVENQEYGEYSLSKDQELTIDNNQHRNMIQINNGSVRMLESSCKNQICVNDGVIDTVGEQIVCLPNRVVVEIIGNESEKEFDAISQ